MRNLGVSQIRDHIGFRDESLGCRAFQQLEYFVRCVWGPIILGSPFCGSYHTAAQAGMKACRGFTHCPLRVVEVMIQNPEP